MADPWVADTVCETHEWRSSAGEVIKFVTRTGATSRFMPPVEIQSLRVPQSHGARFRGARHEPRVVLLPVVVPAPQTSAGRTELRRWAKALDPAKGEGTLTVVQGTAPGRFLNCVYETGLETLTEDNGQPLELAVLGFRASDPYWFDPSAMSLTRDAADAKDIAAEPRYYVPITNAGDVNAWGVFTVHGPAYDIHIANDTTGKTLDIGGAALTASDSVVVDFRPGHKTVKINGTVDGFARLTPNSTMWPFVPGSNTLAIWWFGDVPGTSSYTLTYNLRYLAP